MGGREEQRGLWPVTPTPGSCLSSSRTKGRVLILAPCGSRRKQHSCFPHYCGWLTNPWGMPWLFWTHTKPPLSLIATAHTAAASIRARSHAGDLTPSSQA